MKTRKFIQMAAIAGTFVAVHAAQPGLVRADDTARDNTRVNARDERPGQVTAFDQSSKDEYIEVTRKIRALLTENDNLSSYAKNIKVITTDDGTVTLKGPVRSDAERRQVMETAAKVVERPRVVSQLDVVPDTNSTTN